MRYRIVPRTDDGTFDLLGTYPDGKVDILGNFDNVEDAKDEIKSLRGHMSQGETLQFLNRLKQSLNNI